MPASRDINIHKQMEKEILMGKIWLRLHKNRRDEECATGSNTHRHVYACWTMFYLNSSHLDTNPQSPHGQALQNTAECSELYQENSEFRHPQISFLTLTQTHT